MRPLNVSEVGDALIVVFDDPSSVNDGQTDFYRQALYSYVSERPRPHVAVDLGPVEFLSSSGIALLIGLNRRIKALGGDLVLFQIHPYVMEVLQLMKLTSLFKVVPDSASALTMFSSLPPA
jgi:anti-sigma B factor antagonist